MNIKHEQFIGIYEDVFSKEYCDSVINYFEKMVEAGYTHNRQQEKENTPKSSKDNLIHFATDDPAMNLGANSV